MIQRKVLLVYPAFPGNPLLSYQYMCELYPGVESVMPPLGLLTIAGLLDDRFEVRLADGNVAPVRDADLQWADVVALSGMHPQRGGIDDIVRRSKAFGCATVLGGPSVNICPEYYPEIDALHVGEIGDATAQLVEWMAEVDGPQDDQRVFAVADKTPLEQQPMPRLDICDVQAYLTLPIQFSVGCPFTCEFCDIPVIYGRVARTKAGERVVQEMQAIYDTGFVGTVIFVDDNLVANRKALGDMLRLVIPWQKANGYPYPLASEATLTLARDPKTMALLQEARLTHLFVGVETPDSDTLLAIDKRHNTHDPIVDSVHSIESYGIEVLIGVILGFDTDTPSSGEALQRFVADAQTPIVYFNLLAALPKTPLWHRLEGEGRLLASPEGDILQSESLLSCLNSNVDFVLPADQVKKMLLTAVADVYSPEQVFARYTWNCENVYGHAVQGIPPTRTWAERWFVIRFTLGCLALVLWTAGVKAPWRSRFWSYLRHVRRLKRQGKVASVLEVLLRTVPNAYHLIEWGRRLLAESSEESVEQGTAVVEPGQREAS